MDYTRSPDFVIDADTGFRRHDDTKPVATVQSADDTNSILWSLMEVVTAAGLRGMPFDPSNPETYRVLLNAISRLSGKALDTLSDREGAALVGFTQLGPDGQTDPRAILLSVLQKLRQNVVSVEDYGAIPGVKIDQAEAIQAADAAAAATGRTLVFPPFKRFFVGKLNLSSRDIDFGYCTFIGPPGSLGGGFINWGNAKDKSTGMTDGCVRNLVVDVDGMNNVVTFRMYGNHIRPRIRNLILLNGDFYALGIGGLTSLGDKRDVVNGLDIDGLYIESYRGNSMLGTSFSFGLELFPGVTCFDWSIRNVKTKGLILNKIHAVDGLIISGVDFEATSEFDSQSSAYFEINNCDNANIDANCRFRKPGTTYYAVKIAGDRITGFGGSANRIQFGGRTNGLSVSGVADVVLSPTSVVDTKVTIFGVSTAFAIHGNSTGLIEMRPNAHVSSLDLSGASVELLRLNQGSIDNLQWAGGRWVMYGNNSRFSGVAKARFSHVDIALKGPPQSYAFHADGEGDLRFALCTLDGSGTWDRPFYVTNGASVRVTSNDLSNLVTARLTASGSEALAVSSNNMVNDVLAP
ncbi:hypothetical protein [Burkholderia cepacia]|uniref:hypothetical protein n=1 Tax=Burkholderia cepacia TaxID=292 RepID=UPI002018E505|nr:hypothetical protein [Burkholderia cepacia]UQO36352.1 hypothetical protein L0Z22_27190 [Burkholderia cepacia]UQO50679.1 hypothetical protein L0Z05_33320 [Burkholderia cepacia]UQP04839.1 hypothetical protein L0Z01_10130 [Burkholderia cepacia]